MDPDHPEWDDVTKDRAAHLRNRPDLQKFLGFWEKNLGPSDSLRKALIDLANTNPGHGDGTLSGPDGGAGGDGGFLSFLEMEAGAAGEIGSLDWLEKSFEGGSWKLPELGLKDWVPKLGQSSAAFNAPTSPNWSPNGGGFGTPSGEGSWLPVIGLLVVGAAAYLLWRFLPGTAGTPSGMIDPARRPWPVDPRTVTDRESLVKAFEYLSVLLCGDSARVWNHRTIATALRARVVGADGVADELAGVYEQARYTPPEEPLPRDLLVAARRDLCFLAGVNPE